VAKGSVAAIQGRACPANHESQIPIARRKSAIGQCRNMRRRICGNSGRARATAAGSKGHDSPYRQECQPHLAAKPARGILKRGFYQIRRESPHSLDVGVCQSRLSSKAALFIFEPHLGQSAWLCFAPQLIQ
jgi:hypothetical protein